MADIIWLIPIDSEALLYRIPILGIGRPSSGGSAAADAYAAAAASVGAACLVLDFPTSNKLALSYIWRFTVRTPSFFSSSMSSLKAESS